MISKESRIYLLLPSEEDKEIGRPKYRKYISKINRSILVKEQHRELLRKFFKDEGFKEGGQLWLRVSIEKEGKILAGTEEIATINPLGGFLIREMPLKVIYRTKSARPEEFSLEVEAPKFFNSINFYSSNQEGFIKASTELQKISPSNSSSVIQYSREILHSLNIPLVNIPLYLEHIGKGHLLELPSVQDEIIYLYKIDKSDMKAGLFGVGDNVNSIDKLWDSIELKKLSQRIFYSIQEESLSENIRKVQESALFALLKVISLKPLTIIFALLLFFQMMVGGGWNLKFISSIFPEMLTSGIYASIIWQIITLVVVSISLVIPGYLSFRRGVRAKHYLRRLNKFWRRILLCLLSILSIYLIGGISSLIINFGDRQGLFEVRKSNSLENIFVSIVFALISLVAGFLLGYLFEDGRKKFYRPLHRKKFVFIFLIISIIFPGIAVAGDSSQWISCGYKYNISSNQLHVYKYVRLGGWQDSSRVAIFESNSKKWYADNRWISVPISLVVPNREIEYLDSCNNATGSVSEIESLILTKNGRFLYIVEVLPPEIYSIRRRHIVSTSFSVLDKSSDQYWIKKIYY